jgi:hypothetical protein
MLFLLKQPIVSVIPPAPLEKKAVFLTGPAQVLSMYAGSDTIAAILAIRNILGVR